MIGVLLSALGKAERKKALRLLCEGWRIPYAGGNGDLKEATLSLSKRVGPVLHEKMREAESGHGLLKSSKIGGRPSVTLSASQNGPDFSSSSVRLSTSAII